MLRIAHASLALMTLFTASATAQNTVDFREALQMTFPATVSVTGDAARQSSWISAGFAVATDQVVALLAPNVDEVTVTTIDKTQHTGKVIVRDRVTGLCVIQVEEVDLVSLVIGAGGAEPGLPVVMTWLEDGVGRSQSGMIAGPLNASQPQVGFTQHIDSASHVTATGAPVVDSTGVLVGVTVVGDNGRIVCMPSSQIHRLIDASQKDSPENLKRGMAGISFSTDIGPVVNDVKDGSPAAEAGLQSGDLITKVNDFKVNAYSDVIAAVAMARAGDALQLTVERGDETLTPTLTLADHPQQRKVTLSPLPAEGNGMFGGEPNAEMQVFKQAWQLKDGKLVPLDIDKDGGADMILPKRFQEMFKGTPGGLALPPEFLQPRRVDGFQVERSDTEEALQNLESAKKQYEAQIKELTDKIQALEDK